MSAKNYTKGMVSMTDREICMVKRKRKKMPLRELAAHLRCSVATVSRYENGLGQLHDWQVEKYKEIIDGKAVKGK
jgi:predicted transcriptional regulator